ncbi:MAG: HAMP domain-containing sensor histidine kinase [Bryobacteraceae bacterium]
MTGWRLSRKVIGLGVLNLILAGLAVFVFGRVQYGLGPQSLLTGPARDRILAVGNAFRFELENGADPVELLETYGRRLHAQMYITDPQGHAMLGPQPVLPPVIIERMQDDGRPPPDGPSRGGADDRDAGDRARKGPRKGGRKGPGKGPPKGPPKGPDAPPTEQFFFEVTSSPTAYWTVLRIPIDSGPVRLPGMLVLRSDSLFNTDLFFNWRPWLMLALAIAALSMLCWMPFVRGLTQTIKQMNRVTSEIARGRFDVRVAHRRTDELGHLGTQINRLAERLEDFVRSQKRFLGDTAHELSAPIARIQFALGILEQRVAETGAESRGVETLRDEIQEMSELVSELLSFSKAGMEADSAECEPVPLAELVRRAASREGVDAVIEVGEDLIVSAHRGLLLRAVGNLLRNARLYAGDAGPITVTGRRDGNGVALAVADEGPGLPGDALEQIFEPFYRPQASRSRDTGGVGLGLAIVKTCAEACGGSASCRNRTPRGLEVTMLLPAA